LEGKKLQLIEAGTIEVGIIKDLTKKISKKFVVKNASAYVTEFKQNETRENQLPMETSLETKYLEYYLSKSPKELLKALEI